MLTQSLSSILERLRNAKSPPRPSRGPGNGPASGQDMLSVAFLSARRAVSTARAVVITRKDAEGVCGAMQSLVSNLVCLADSIQQSDMKAITDVTDVCIKTMDSCRPFTTPTAVLFMSGPLSRRIQESFSKMADLLEKLHAAKGSTISNPAALRTPSMTSLQQRAGRVGALYERLLDGHMTEAAKFAHVREILLIEGVTEADLEAKRVDLARHLLTLLDGPTKDWLEKREVEVITATAAALLYTVRSEALACGSSPPREVMKRVSESQKQPPAKPKQQEAAKPKQQEVTKPTPQPLALRPPEVTKAPTQVSKPAPQLQQLFQLPQPALLPAPQPQPQPQPQLQPQHQPQHQPQPQPRPQTPPASPPPQPQPQCLICLKPLRCPITNTLMRDPVYTLEGHAYERTAVKKWLKNNDTDPVTGKLLTAKTLITAWDLKETIEEWLATAGITHEDYDRMMAAEEASKVAAQVAAIAAHTASVQGQQERAKSPAKGRQSPGPAFPESAFLVPHPAPNAAPAHQAPFQGPKEAPRQGLGPGPAQPQTQEASRHQPQPEAPRAPSRGRQAPAASPQPVQRGPQQQQQQQQIGGLGGDSHLSESWRGSRRPSMTHEAAGSPSQQQPVYWLQPQQEGPMGGDMQHLEQWLAADRRISQTSQAMSEQPKRAPQTTPQPLPLPQQPSYWGLPDAGKQQQQPKQQPKQMEPPPAVKPQPQVEQWRSPRVSQTSQGGYSEQSHPASQPGLPTPQMQPNLNYWTFPTNSPPSPPNQPAQQPKQGAAAAGKAQQAEQWINPRRLSMSTNGQSTGGASDTSYLSSPPSQPPVQQQPGMWMFPNNVPMAQPQQQQAPKHPEQMHAPKPQPAEQWASPRRVSTSSTSEQFYHAPQPAPTSAPAPATPGLWLFPDGGKQQQQQQKQQQQEVNKQQPSAVEQWLNQRRLSSHEAPSEHSRAPSPQPAQQQSYWVFPEAGQQQQQQQKLPQEQQGPQAGKVQPIEQWIRHPSPSQASHKSAHEPPKRTPQQGPQPLPMPPHHSEIFPARQQQQQQAEGAPGGMAQMIDDFLNQRRISSSHACHEPLPEQGRRSPQPGPQPMPMPPQPEYWVLPSSGQPPQQVGPSGGKAPQAGPQTTTPPPATRAWDKPVRLFVRTLTDKKYQLEVSLQDVVLRLKYMIQVRDGSPVEKQRLIYNKQVLEDDRTLAEYNMREGDTIYLTVPTYAAQGLGGCCPPPPCM